MAVAGPVGLADVLRVVRLAVPGQRGAGAFQAALHAGQPQLTVVNEEGLPEVKGYGGDAGQIGAPGNCA